jgi:hypothetical protein
VPAQPGVEDEVDVDDVVVAGATAQLAHRASSRRVEGRRDHVRRPQELREGRLPWTTTPSLSQDAWDDMDLHAARGRRTEQITHARVAALDRDQAPGVQRDA